MHKGLYSLKEDTEIFRNDFETHGGGSDLEDYYFGKFYSFNDAHDYFGNPTFTLIDSYYNADSDSYFFLDGPDFNSARDYRNLTSSLIGPISFVMYQLFERDKMDETIYYSNLAFKMSDYIIANF